MERKIRKKRKWKRDGGNKHMDDGWMHGGELTWGISPMGVAEPYA